MQATKILKCFDNIQIFRDQMRFKEYQKGNHFPTANFHILSNLVLHNSTGG